MVTIVVAVAIVVLGAMKEVGKARRGADSGSRVVRSHPRQK